VLVAALHAGSDRPVVGVDVNRAMLQRLRDRAPGADAVRVGPRDPLPFATGTFATVSLLDVAEHVPDEHALLAEIARVLAPGGRLLLSVPAKHVFSILDPDNLKLHWPAAHRLVWQLRRGRRAHEQTAAAEQAVPGMVGDLAIERDEHTNFEPAVIAAVIESVGLHVDAEYGSGLFFRWVQIPALVLPGAAGRFAERLMIADAHRFTGGPGTGLRRRANLFVTAMKPAADQPSDSQAKP
jgi:SAM-dependent methyltransferase